MIHWLRNIVAYVVCAIASHSAAVWIESTIAEDVLIPNLTTIVIALLAINVQTTAVIAVKLRELVEKTGSGFSRTVAQFRLAIFEQACLVLMSLALTGFAKSALATSATLPISLAAFFVFYASLHIFIDTTVGLLVALFPEDG